MPPREPISLRGMPRNAICAFAVVATNAGLSYLSNQRSTADAALWADMMRRAREQDASGLAAVSIEVWLNTYLRDGVSQLFADYVLSEFRRRSFEMRSRIPAWRSGCRNTGSELMVL